MHIIEVRLFELQLKGDRLHEINAEEVLAQRAVDRARMQALGRFIRHIGQLCRMRVVQQSTNDDVKFQSTY